MAQLLSIKQDYCNKLFITLQRLKLQTFTRVHVLSSTKKKLQKKNKIINNLEN